MLNNYPKVWALGHKAISELFFDPVVVQEKVDGSQISFGVIDGVLEIKSHHCKIEPRGHYEGMFEEAVQSILEMEPYLHEGWTYRGEYLRKPHHNTLTYSRIPKKHIIIFDISTGLEDYMSPESVAIEADKLGLEVVPTYDLKARVDGFEELNKYLERESILGGTTIEGVVFKNYLRFGRDKKNLMGKFVSEKFKEANGATHKIKNKLEVIEEIGNCYKTEARWNKAVQHLQEKGLLTQEPKDIGPLLKELSTDLLEECGDEIKEKLFKQFWSKINKYACSGFPQWYKSRLAQQHFKENIDA
jgi:hypothetical protein